MSHCSCILTIFHFRGPFFGPHSRFGLFIDGPCTFFRGQYCLGLVISGPIFRLQSLFFGDISDLDQLGNGPCIFGDVFLSRSRDFGTIFRLESLFFRGHFPGLSHDLDQLVNGPCIFGDAFLC